MLCQWILAYLMKQLPRKASGKHSGNKRAPGSSVVRDSAGVSSLAASYGRRRGEPVRTGRPARIEAEAALGLALRPPLMPAPVELVPI